MKVTSHNGTNFLIYTPQEIIEKRQRNHHEKPLNHYPAILKKFIQTTVIHGLEYYESVLELCYKITDNLSYRYNFKYGQQIPISLNSIPEYLRRNREGEKLHFLEYTLAILQALDWPVYLSEDESFYFFNFGPLLSLTPEEVQLEIDARTNQIASKALQVINLGLIEHKNRFTDKELFFESVSVPDLYIVLTKKLPQLLGPQWNLVDRRDFSISVVPNIPR